MESINQGQKCIVTVIAVLFLCLPFPAQSITHNKCLVHPAFTSFFLCVIGLARESKRTNTTIAVTTHFWCCDRTEREYRTFCPNKVLKSSSLKSALRIFVQRLKRSDDSLSFVFCPVCPYSVRLTTLVAQHKKR